MLRYHRRVQFFTGTRSPLPIGVPLWAYERKASPFELLLEAARPEDKASRLTSFFLTTDPLLIELLGPAQKHFYEVKPDGPVTKVSYGWLEKVEVLLGVKPWERGAYQRRLYQLNRNKVNDLLERYWNGDRTAYGFEYLAPQITAVKEISNPRRKVR